MWGVMLWAIGGGFPALTLYNTQAEAETVARKYNDKDDWVAEVKPYQVAPGVFENEGYPIVLRPAQLMDRVQAGRNKEAKTINTTEEQTVRSILAGETKKFTEGRAQPGMFQIVLVDTFDYTRTICGEVETLPEAIRRAEALIEGHQMVKARVYDDAGQERFCVER